jgi:hypothetical protein
MDFTTFIEIIIAVAVIFLFIKFIVSPMLKLVLGIIAFAVLVYLLQKFFNLNLGQIFAPLLKILKTWH